MPTFFSYFSSPATSRPRHRRPFRRAQRFLELWNFWEKNRRTLDSLKRVIHSPAREAGLQMFIAGANNAERIGPSASGGSWFREPGATTEILSASSLLSHRTHTHTDIFAHKKPHSSIILANVTWFYKERLNTHAVNLSCLWLVGVALLLHPGTFLQRCCRLFFNVLIYLFVWPQSLHWGLILG